MYFWTCYPLGLDLPRHRQPWLTVVVAGLMVATFVWTRWLPTALPVLPWDLIFYAGATPPWTVLTALFMHADWLHLLGNLAYLVAFMPALEERLGRFSLLLLLVATGVGGNLCHGVAAWNDWLGQGGLGILGASGAVSGVLGYALLRVPHARLVLAYWVFAPLQGQNRAGRTSLPLPVGVLIWLALQVANALLAGESGSTVSYPAHLGGFAGGLFMGLILGSRGEGKGEAKLMEARRHMDSGSAWPAVGALTEYLEREPDDLEARCELARALLMARVLPRAAATYREAYRRAVAGGRWDLALEYLAEGRRAAPGLNLTVDELGEAAQQADRAGQKRLAVDLYQDLVLKSGRHPVIDRGWVRLVLLLHGHPEWRDEAEQWLTRARRELPPGAWRDYLDREFMPPATGREGLTTAPASGRTGPGS